MGYPEPVRRRRPRVLALIAIAAVVSSAVVALPVVAEPARAAEPAAAATPPATVSTDPLPTPQINGVVWDQEIVGSTVFVAGNFSTARPAGAAAGTNQVTRTHLLSYNLVTGALTGWAPSVNAQVRAIDASPDGTRLYAVGDFTTVNGGSRSRVVAFDTASGAVVASFAASANNYVSAVAATDATVYLGGVFNRMTGVSRTYLAAVTAATGAATAWAPVTTGGRPYAIVVSPDRNRVVVGGDFLTANGSDRPGYGLFAADAATGVSLPFAVNDRVRNAGVDAAVFSLSSDGDSVYGTGYVFGRGGNLEGAFRASWDGALQWVQDCHGDTYSVAPMGDVVYTASHAHYCGNVEGKPQTEPWDFHRGMAFTKTANGTITDDPYGYPNWVGTPKPDVLNFYPTINLGTFTGMYQGAWSVEANGQYVIYGGEFTQVNNRGQQGLVRYAVRSVAPNLDGPRLTGANFAPSLDSPAAGVVRVSWPANWDRDDGTLTYQVIRDGRTGTPAHQTTVTSSFFDRPNTVFLDTGLAPGSTHTYRLRAIDPWGNNGWGDTLSITVATTGTPSDYAAGVLADQPAHYWRLGDGGSGTAADAAGRDTATAGSGVAFGASGALAGDLDTAAAFDGTGNGLVAGSTRIWRDNSFSTEAWVKTTSTAGGKIIGFGSERSGNSGAYDRHVYMNAAGRISFGVWQSAARVVTGAKSYNDGRWHHVVASLGPAGQELYVDGRRVGSNPAVTWGQNYWGYWRVGGDNSWDGAPYLQGAIDEVAIYSAPLTSAQILSHYALSGRTADVPVAPSDPYGAAVFAEDPLLYWRLGETGGTTARDAGPQENAGVYSGSYAQGAAGALPAPGDPSAVRFSSGTVASAVSFANPSTYTQEAWFQTSSTQGGKIMGFGSAQSGLSSSYDRHVYVQDDGRLVFGTYTGQLNTVTSTSAYNDGRWHHVAASQSSDGMKLYVDGALVGTDPQSAAEGYTGYWRIGGDWTWGSSSPWLDGVIDEFAVYSAALPAATIARHFALGQPPAPNSPPSAAFTTVAAGTRMAFDAAGSADVDGTIASYAWDFGDGSSGTGVAPTHDYGTPGSYTATLTVTDDDGAAATTSRTLTVQTADPVAAFTTGTSGLTASVDGRSSSDSDGTIANWAWDFGDGGSGSGSTATHAYATAGTYPVTLTVTDDDGATARVSQPVTVAAPANQAPTARIVATAAGLTASLSGATSSDPDGAIANYSWALGDGATASGSTASHAYAAPGTYTVTLTVTDDRGATASATAPVTVTAPPAAGVLGQDGFDRTASGSWGSAPTGGAWTTSPASSSSVSGSAGVLTHGAGTTRRATLGSLSAADVEVTTRVSADKATTSGHIVVGTTARQVSASDYYQARIRLLPGGQVGLQLTRGSSSAVIATTTISGLAYRPGDQLDLRFRVTGSSPTTLSARVWATGTPEPTTWQLTGTDATPALQAAGGLGIESYVSTSATNAPVAVRVHEYGASMAGGTPPPANQAPTAEIAASASGLTATLSGSGSRDPDGTIASYTWDFGDGTTGSGVDVPHVYAAAGTYTVALRVTDDRGATGTASVAVTVTAPPAGAPIAQDAFDRVVAGGWGAATTGGPWTASAPTSSSVADGAGAFAHTAGSTRRAVLGSTSVADVDVSAVVSVDKATTSGHIVAGVVSRQVSATDYYQARVRLLPSGQVALQITRGSGSVVLANATVDGLTYAPGDQLSIRLRTVGAAPTTLSAKIWRTGTAEPTGWLLTATDAASALQAPGQLGVESYVSGSATNAPVAVRVHDFTATPAG